MDGEDGTADATTGSAHGEDGTADATTGNAHGEESNEGGAEHPANPNGLGVGEAHSGVADVAGVAPELDPRLAVSGEQPHTTLFARRRKSTSFLEVIMQADSFPPDLEQRIIMFPDEHSGLPLRAGERDIVVGFVSPRVLEDVKRYPAIFEVRMDAVRFASGLDTAERRTAGVDKFFRQLRVENKYACLRGWREEVFAVYGSDNWGCGVGPLSQGRVASDVGKSNNVQRPEISEQSGNARTDAAAQWEPLFVCERAAAGLLGLRSYGCHLNAYVRLGSGEIRMWISRRSRLKPTYPGMLDNLVGGGLAAGILPFDNIVKECAEEAGIPAELAAKAVPCGAITYFMENDERGWIPDTEYVYDLELDYSFLPSAVDGEVESFLLLDCDTVMDHVRRGDFMPESSLVTIDFLIRHGFIHPANEPDYLEIIARMHRRHSAPGPRFRSNDVAPRPRNVPAMSIVVAPIPPSPSLLASAGGFPSPSCSATSQLSATTPGAAHFKPILPNPFIALDKPLVATSNTAIIPRMKRGKRSKAKAESASHSPAQSCTEPNSPALPSNVHAILPEAPASLANFAVRPANGGPVFNFPYSAPEYSGTGVHPQPTPPSLPVLAPPYVSLAEAASNGRQGLTVATDQKNSQANTAVEDSQKPKPRKRYGNCSVCNQFGCIGRSKRARCPQWPHNDDFTSKGS